MNPENEPKALAKGLAKGHAKGPLPFPCPSLPLPSIGGGEKSQDFDTLRYLAKAIQDNGSVELRHLPSKRWGWFDDAELMFRQTDKFQTGNMFLSLNRPEKKPGIPNRMIEGREEFPPIANGSVTHFTRLLFDLDPVRQGECPSTDTELALAKEQAKRIFDYLRRVGFPDPLVAMSGNGYHLLYRVHLPNSEEVRKQLRNIYSGLYQEFSTEAVKFDRSVKSPGQIAGIYGSWKRKGVETVDRKYRQSRIVSWPHRWLQVSPHCIASLASVYTPKIKPRSVSVRPAGAGDYRSLDIVSLFQARGLYQYYIEDVMHAVQCPFEHTSGTHSRGEAVIYANVDEWPGFSCKHASCADRRIIDVINHFGDVDQFCSRQFQPRKTQ